jgi:5'-nucleotidase
MGMWAVNGRSPFGAAAAPDAASSGDGLRDRYASVLGEVGLDYDKLSHVRNLPSRRAINPFQIFCNRELKMDGIRAIGFDMDYTLAQYKQPAFDRLAFDGAKEKLVRNLGYPEQVLNFQYDPSFWSRGLIMDTLRGNFLKIDRHKYVRVAYHGFDKMSSTTRKLLYSRTFNKVMSFSEKQYVNMDTLFQFVDAHLFASLVNLKDKGEHESLDYKTYEELYRHVRECVDLCHRDGVIKDEVARNPDRYLVLDPGLLPMMKKYRDAGVKLFLLTNSLWEYTSTAMNYLYHGKRLDDVEQRKNEWLDLFDIVIVGSCKPAYMLDPYLNLFRVNPADGSLRNTDGTYEIEALGEDGASKFLAQGKTFQGGNWLHLQAMLEIEAGEEILYVGDHLYSDVLRSKRTLGWRSAFIMPELEEEMRVFNENSGLTDKISALRELREELGVYEEENILDNPTLGQEERDRALESLREEDTILKEKLTELAAQWHGSFHPIWGAMFNSGYQDSRFAFYVQNYACLYTSRATNLGLVSTSRSFRTGLEMLPHDKLLDDPRTEFVDKDPWSNLAGQ